MKKRFRVVQSSSREGLERDMNALYLQGYTFAFTVDISDDSGGIFGLVVLENNTVSAESMRLSEMQSMGEVAIQDLGKVT